MAAKLHLKIVPGAAKTCLAGWLGETLKLRVAAPPEKGKANAAVLELLSQVLEVPKRDIEIVSGKTSPQKTVQIEGMTKEELEKRLGEFNN